ncbi:Hypothetical protein ORPV_415 [Orpheovirus IHUMI-LCC2]|uniref:Uncharacterized protein n=1 Tax=Orpheovirus IHUMI-LCC2 TaxID=2023057 RepID=A0A2I2L4C6_9VIRU|nr:Hypothetical protein ORPV_415 [Orpheovirus IHUMI-LCC2]SNW62319.1 Hypothetical protein ORPV_415 [Orpheovirus IHUMI-LCC2]
MWDEDIDPYIKNLLSILERMFKLKYSDADIFKFMDKHTMSFRNNRKYISVLVSLCMKYGKLITGVPYFGDYPSANLSNFLIYSRNYNIDNKYIIVNNMDQYNYSYHIYGSKGNNESLKTGYDPYQLIIKSDYPNIISDILGDKISLSTGINIGYYGTYNDILLEMTGAQEKFQRNLDKLNNDIYDDSDSGSGSDSDDNTRKDVKLINELSHTLQYMERVMIGCIYRKDRDNNLMTKIMELYAPLKEELIVKTEYDYNYTNYFDSFILRTMDYEMIKTYYTLASRLINNTQPDIAWFVSSKIPEAISKQFIEKISIEDYTLTSRLINNTQPDIAWFVSSKIPEVISRQFIEKISIEDYNIINNLSLALSIQDSKYINLILNHIHSMKLEVN